MEAGGRVIGHLAQADATGAQPAVFDLDGANDQHFALMAAPATDRDRVIFAAASDFGFIYLDETGERAGPGASMLQRSLAQISHAVL
jgi:hypothetical protein